MLIERLYGKRIRPRWWSLLNWLQGYKFGSMQRCRKCDHTSPYHYRWCERAGGAMSDGDG